MRTTTQEAFDNLASVITSNLDLGEFDLDGELRTIEMTSGDGYVERQIGLYERDDDGNCTDLLIAKFKLRLERVS
jgi:hypothetical protein